MNIQAEQHKASEQPIYNFIKMVLNTNNHEHNQDDSHELESARTVDSTMVYAKQILDLYFPLTHGSHQNVCSYVVYYNQLLAFFEDGQQSGLRQPKQFVALTGHRSEPTTILLQSNGFHLELSFAADQCDLAGIEDVQLEAELMTIMNGENLPSSRSWTSLITGQVSSTTKLFTAKDGSAYEL